MYDVVIWIDSEHAQVFALKPEGISKTQLKRSGKHHDHETDAKPFYTDLSAKVKEAHHVLLLGPGMAKNHFVSFLKTHHPLGLDKKIVGVEPSDHPTDNQILASARKFFKTYDLYNEPISEA